MAIRGWRLAMLHRLRPGRLVGLVILVHFASTLGFIAPSARKAMVQ
jgi:hypothetical protein